MNKLLRAGFVRLRKNKLFGLLAVFSIALALFMICTQYRAMKKENAVIRTEDIMLYYSTIVGIASAVFTSLFLGVEYSDGVIRNKIGTGHKRSDIYLSNLILTFAVSIFSYILYCVTVLAIGIPLFGGITMPTLKLLMLLGCIFVTIIAYSGIFTFAAMLISNKAVSAIVSVMLAFGMILAAVACLSILDAPKTISSASLVDGEIKYEQIPNPRYPSEQKKKVCQILTDINPAGQMFRFVGGAYSGTKLLPLYSLCELILFSGVGILLFKKKELK